ncbi:Tubby- protein 2, partial [Coemansia sp. RSA 2607]
MPEWCTLSNAFVLDFEGRVSVPSVKNFQLVHPDEDAYVVLQFGRVADHMFTLDMRYPMTPMLALAIAASNMDRKLG